MTTFDVHLIAYPFFFKHSSVLSLIKFLGQGALQSNYLLCKKVLTNFEFSFEFSFII